MVIPSPLVPSPPLSPEVPLYPIKSHPVSTTPIFIGPHRSRPVRTFCNRKAWPPVRICWEPVVPLSFRKTDNLFETIVIRGTIGGPSNLQPVRNYGTPWNHTQSYQNSFPIKIIFTRPVFDGLIFYQKYFLCLNDCRTGVYENILYLCWYKNIRI